MGVTRPSNRLSFLTCSKMSSREVEEDDEGGIWRRNSMFGCSVARARPESK